jgi:hypothetical protein
MDQSNETNIIPNDIKSGETQIMDFFGSYTLLSIFNSVYNSLIKKILPKADITQDGSKITKFLIKVVSSIRAIGIIIGAIILLIMLMTLLVAIIMAIYPENGETYANTTLGVMLLISTIIGIIWLSNSFIYKIIQYILNFVIFIGMFYLISFIFMHDTIADWWRIAPPAIYLLSRVVFLFYHLYNATSNEKSPFGLPITQIILMISTIFITGATFMVYGGYTGYYDQYMDLHGNKPPELTGKYKLFFDHYNDSIRTYLLFSMILITTTLFCYHHSSKLRCSISILLAALSAIILIYTTSLELGNSVNYLHIIRNTIV